MYSIDAAQAVGNKKHFFNIVQQFNHFFEIGVKPIAAVIIYAQVSFG
jgi:hypothetical protein